MNTGLGMSEIVLILMLVLVFFGSKEIPQAVRMIAKFMARIRLYTDKVKREIDSVTQMTELPPQGNQVVMEKKNVLRKQYIDQRKALTPEERREKSGQIFARLEKSPYIQNAATILMYAHMGSEVETADAIRRLLGLGKRIVLPYSKSHDGDMGIAEIHDFDTDVSAGSAAFPEVIQSLRKPFFKSDIQLVLCPGVAFDISGARLGRGKSFYDRFLKELKGQVPIIGIAFDCQICKDTIPFEYHDISMDQIITESGFLLAEKHLSTEPSRLPGSVPQVNL